MVDKEKIKEILEKIRVSLQADGGDAELVDITDEGLVKLRLVGACAGCPMSQMTLKNGIERSLKENVDQAIVVEEVA
jgi:Fe-S cluster biogenesis protein NfuA